MSVSWVGPMPWPQFPGQPPFQMHSIIPTETLRSDNAHVPMAIQKTWSLYLHMAYGLIRRKKWLNSVEPGYYHRPAKTASTERRTQETMRGQASVSVFLYNTALCLLLAFLLTLSKEGRTWSTTARFGISIPGFWTPAPTFSCCFSMSRECRLLLGDTEFSLHFKLNTHRLENWARDCAYC